MALKRSTVDQAARWLSSRFRPGALILVYHRVGDAGIDPFGTTVSADAFAEQLEVVRRSGTPVTLAELARGLRDGELPPRAIAVTFDDGYADNLHVARPLLERHDLPATLFVTSDFIGREEPPWWDLLAALLLGDGALPQRLELRDGERSLGWNVDRDRRYLLFREVYRLLRPLPDARREPLMEQLREQAGPGSAPVQRMLDADELRRLAGDGQFAVGCHTRSHPVLSTLDERAQREEIEPARERLRELTGRPVESFAYPYGGRDDYDATSVEIVRRAGFDCACTAEHGVVVEGGDPHRLPRLWAPAGGGEALARLLRTWFPLTGRGTA
jgi:peptidoglycan/xylan/chitin deacetylase (PgdA/CDA1 family)